MSVLGVSSYQRTPKMRQKVLRQSMSLFLNLELKESGTASDRCGVVSYIPTSLSSSMGMQMRRGQELAGGGRRRGGSRRCGWRLSSAPRMLRRTTARDSTCSRAGHCSSVGNTFI